MVCIINSVSSKPHFAGLGQLIANSSILNARSAKKNSSIISLEDILLPEEELHLLIKNIQPKSLSLNELTAFYAKSHANKTLSHSLLSLDKPIEDKTYPLHIAARDGDLETIINLLEQNFDINKKDLRSITPLHVAVLFGQQDAVLMLIKNGAEVDAKGYEDHTPLHFALMKHQYDIAKILVNDGNADPNQIASDDKNAFNYILDDLGVNLLMLAETQDKGLAKKIDQILDTINTLAAASDTCYYLDVIEQENSFLAAPIPVSMLLNVISCYAPTEDLKNKLLLSAETIKETDPSEALFVHAKNILHMFPTGETYKINIGTEKEIWLQSEGHFGSYTTTLASNSLNTYILSLSSLAESELKSHVFDSLQSIYQSATFFTTHAGQKDTALLAFELYEKGETVLLPSGWEGHFVDIIISKNQALYVVANSGARYHGESPDYQGDPAGVLFYKILEPEAIDPDFFYAILNNEEQINLELEYTYLYGVFEKTDEIVRDTQEYGNCGWESHRDAIEGILYIELLNQGINTNEAKEIAHEYYQEWDHFHGNYVIDQYMANNPILPFEALLDMFKEIHKKDHFTPANHDHAQKIADAMTSTPYIDEFKAWLSSDMDLVDKLIKNILQAQHGVDIETLLYDPLSSDNIVQEVELNTSIAEVIQIENNFPQIDIMLPLDQSSILI